MKPEFFAQLPFCASVEDVFAVSVRIFRVHMTTEKQGVAKTQIVSPLLGPFDTKQSGAIAYDDARDHLPDVFSLLRPCATIELSVLADYLQRATYFRGVVAEFGAIVEIRQRFGRNSKDLGGIG